MSEKLKSTNTKKPRNKVKTPFFNGRRITRALYVMLVLIAAGGGWWAWSSGTVERVAEKVRWQLIATSSQIGFKVDEILVVGRRETKQEDLLKAIRLARGAPILAFDLDAARRRVETLPWVQRATVERMLPDTILLNVVERRPIAVWQHQGRFALIDNSGEVILRRGLGRFSDLIVVVGEDAPSQAAGLIETLAVAPELRSWVKAAVWVGGRRWNLRLKGDIDVRLPETDPASAWIRLAEYEKAHQLLERDVQVLDLRIPDRLIVRKTPRPEGKSRKGQET
jgi:cell division protein FtsQ